MVICVLLPANRGLISLALCEKRRATCTKCMLLQASSLLLQAPPCTSSAPPLLRVMQLRLRRRQLFNCNHRAREIERDRARERPAWPRTSMDGPTDCPQSTQSAESAQRFPFRLRLFFFPFSRIALRHIKRRHLHATLHHSATTSNIIAVCTHLRIIGARHANPPQPVLGSIPPSVSLLHLLLLSGKFRNHRIRCCSCINQKLLYLCGDSCYNSIASVYPLKKKTEKKTK